MAKLDHSYRRIAADLRDRIVDGRYRCSRRLPTENDLSRRYGVSRMTVRRALGVLQEERLIRRQQGSGTFVSPTPPRKIPLMIDYTGSMKDHAPNLARKVLSWKWIPAAKAISELLEIDEDDVILYAERVDDAKGVPVAWDQCYIPRSFGDALTEKHLGRVDFVEIWTRTCGFRLEACRQFIEAECASRQTCAYLNMKPRQPVLKSTEIYSTYKSRPAGIFISYYNPAQIWISSRYRWTELHDGR